jgi:tetratricopeptide (TPR) repeat protein
MFDDEEDDEDLGKELNEALARYEQSREDGQFPYFPSDHLDFIIEHYMTQGEIQNAGQCLELALEIYPNVELFKLRQAQYLSNLGEVNKALKLLDTINYAEFELDFISTKAVIFSQLRDHKNAIKLYRQALELANSDERDDLYLDLASELQAMNDLDGAIKVLNQALTNNPNNEVVIYEIAFCYDQIGDFERAIKAYKDFIDNNPYSFTAWYNLGNSYSKMEDFENAINAYDYCIIINEDFTPAKFNLGNAYLSSEKYDEAIECFQECITKDGEDSLVICYLGECYENLEQYDKAIEFYNKSIELTPELPEPWVGKGIVMDLKGETLEGIGFIKHGLELDPDNAGYWHVLAGAAEKVEDLILTHECYKKARLLDPNSDEIFCDYIAFLCEQDVDLGLQYVQTVKENERVNAWYLAFLYANWIKSKATFVIKEYELLILSDPIHAKELFLYFPDMEDDKKFKKYLNK